MKLKLNKKSKKSYDFLFNFSNIRSGGALQVAVSVITELSFNKIPSNSFFLISSAVHEQTKHLEIYHFINYKIYDSGILNGYWSSIAKYSRISRLSFTLFGPKYSASRSMIEVVGFAQPWIIYPDNEVYQSYSLSDKIKIRFKYFLQELLYARSDRLIVELEHVKEALCKTKFLSKIPVSVVNNCVSSVYQDKKDTESYLELKSCESLKIGFLSRDYAHKNLNILGRVHEILEKYYKIPVVFVVSLSELEWKNKSDNFKHSCINLGVIQVQNGPKFYNSIDAVIFPSFLECFSATPIEAMICRKPLFASDRPFIKDICGDFAVYFDPLSAESIAKKIADYHFGTLKFDLEGAFRHVEQFTYPERRVKSYIEVLNNVRNNDDV